MEIFGHIEGIVAYVVPMIILLGLLIFVHELGHFLVAKYFKVKVETFSLGFGPKLLKYKRGDTVYAISAIPLGGYVKMFGDDPTAEVSAELKKVAFNHKPVSQRIAIVLAGPLMNFFFAILVFAFVAMMGEEFAGPQVGDVEEKSPAHAVGFRSGDTIKKIGDMAITTWDDLRNKIETSAEQTLPVEVLRADGSTSTLQVTPKLGPNKNIMSWTREVGDIDGLNFLSRASFVGVRDPKSPAAVAGLKAGDMISKINGTTVSKWRELEAEFGKSAASGTVALEITRGALEEGAGNKPEIKQVTISFPASTSSGTALKAAGIEYPELYLANVEKNSPAAKAGLVKGDRLLSIDGKPVETFEQVAGIIRSYGDRQPEKAGEDGEKTQPLNIVVAREGEEKTISVVPNIKKRMNAQGKEDRRFEIGIRPLIIDAPPMTVTIATSNPLTALGRGWQQTIKWTDITVLGFVRMIQREVSPKNIGGLFSIGQMAQKSWELGLSKFLFMMALISINLFVLNLLPVPVLDGGHLVFYTIEAIKGAPLSMRKMEIAQQVGLVLLLCLMGFALFNDVSRLLN